VGVVTTESMTMCVDDLFGERPADPGPSAGALGARLSIGFATFQTLQAIAGILEKSACSEAAVRLAAMALRQAIADIALSVGERPAT
jgi:hypothetical protein